jgi:hypothetical protein
MHGTLRLGQELEGSDGSFGASKREAGTLDQPPDIVELTVGMLLRMFDRKPEGLYPTGLDGLGGIYLEIHAELLDRARHLRERRPRGD